MTSFVVPAGLATEMMDHAADEAPREACGLLVGDAPGRLLQVVRTTNIDTREDRFLIDPNEHHHTIGESEAAGLSIIGVYHSHPRGPGQPSETDRAAQLDPHWVSLIVAPNKDEWRLRAFRIRDGVVSELAVVEESAVASLR